MARYGSDYDWRGIALLTQQLTQLFEPSKAKLMSKQHEHDMNLLMAKKSWDMQNNQLKTLMTEYSDLTETYETEKRAVKRLGSKELVEAGMGDGSRVDDAAMMYEKNDIRKLDDMRELSNKYVKMIADREEDLFRFKLYNDQALAGEAFSKAMVSKPGVKDPKEYDVLAESDGVPGLSYREKQHGLNMYLKDTGVIVGEDEDGIEQSIWNGKEYERLRVRPEAVAFISGYNQTIKKEGLTDAAMTGGDIKYKDMNARQLTDMYNNQVATIDRLNKKHQGGDKNAATIGQYIMAQGDTWVRNAEWAQQLNTFEEGEVDAYIGASNVRTKLLPFMAKKGISPDIDISKLGHVITDPMRDFFKKAIPGVEINPNILYDQISAKSLDPQYPDVIMAYEELLRDYNTIPMEKRIEALNFFNSWVAK